MWDIAPPPPQPSIIKCLFVTFHFYPTCFRRTGFPGGGDGGKTQEVNEDNDDFEYRLPSFFKFLRLVAALWNVKKYGESVLSCILCTCQFIKVAIASGNKII
jgi:hypothetical protein